MAKNKIYMDYAATTYEILEKIPETKLNGDRYKRLPGNINVTFRFAEGEI